MHEMTISSEDDEGLAIAVQASLDHSKGSQDTPPPTNAASSSSVLPSARFTNPGNIFEFSTPLKTALSIANAGPSRGLLSPSRNPSSSFARPNVFPEQRSNTIRQIPAQISSQPDAILQKNPVQEKVPYTAFPASNSEVDSDEDMEEVINSVPAVDSPPPQSPGILGESQAVLPEWNNATPGPSTIPLSNDGSWDTPPLFESDLHSAPLSAPATSHFEDNQAGPETFSRSQSNVNHKISSDEMDDFAHFESRTPSPSPGPSDPHRQASPPVEIWDAAHEMDPVAEEGEFARFMSQVKGKNIDDVRREIDDEITSLNRQKKVAMRDSEEINQQMIAQIMVCNTYCAGCCRLY